MKWIEFSPHNTRALPRSPALYAIYLDRKLAYIGQARNLCRRLEHHRLATAIAEGCFKGVACADIRLKIRPCQIADLARAEKRLIARLEPSLNSTHCSAHRRRRAVRWRLGFDREMTLDYG